MDRILFDFVSAGLPVLPTKSDKTPLVRHGFLDARLPTVDDYLKIERCGYAIKTGNDQTRIECIDFDVKHMVFPNVILDKIRDLMDFGGLYIETTPSGGRHVIYRRESPGQGSKKLAFCAGYKEAMIETRGRGGYVVVAPTPGYVTTQGDIKNLPIISDERADELLEQCRSLNEVMEKTYKYSRTTPAIRIYNKAHASDVYSQLLAEGWTETKEHQDRWWLARPGKTNGTSATLYKDGGYLYVFTSSTRFNPARAYSPVEILGEKLAKTESEMRIIAEEEVYGESIRPLIVEIIKNEDKLKLIEVKTLAAVTVIKDMQKRGRFYRDDNYGYYFRDLALVPVDQKSSMFATMMYDWYGLIKNDPVMAFILSSIEAHAMAFGDKTVIRRYSYFDGVSVYVDNFNGHVFKIDKKDITQQDNGADGVLFLKTDNTPVSYGMAFDGGAGAETLFDGIRFSEDDIMPEESKFLLCMWICSIFVLDCGRPILAFIGEKGSGKTFWFRKLLVTLFGNDKKLTTLPEKKQDFDAMVSNNKLIVLDNADTSREWLNDSLASCATKTTLSLRKLYTTNDYAEYPVDCFIGLTSRTPKFTRDDVTDRLLIFNVERFDSFHGEAELLRAAIEKRDAVMSFIFDFVKKCISVVGKIEGQSITRMADFELFCRAINPESADIFRKMADKQRDFAEDIFSDLFYRWCKTQTEKIKIKTAAELSDELAPIAKQLNHAKYYLSSHSIGFKMKREYDFCKIERLVLANRKSDYHLTILCEQEANAASWA